MTSGLYSSLRLSMARILNRIKTGGQHFNEEQVQSVEKLFGMLKECIDTMNAVLKDTNAEVHDFRRTVKYYCEDLKTKNIADVNDQNYSYALGTIYADFISECQKFSGYVENVVQARLGIEK